MTIIYKNPAKTLNYDNYINYVKSRKYQTKTNYAIVTNLNSLVHVFHSAKLTLFLKWENGVKITPFCWC